MSRADSFNDIQLIMMFTVSQLGLIKNMEIKRSGVSTILREGCFFLCFFYFKFSKVVFFFAKWRSRRESRLMCGCRWSKVKRRWAGTTEAGSEWSGLVVTWLVAAGMCSSVASPAKESHLPELCAEYNRLWGSQRWRELWQLLAAKWMSHYLQGIKGRTLWVHWTANSDHVHSHVFIYIYIHLQLSLWEGRCQEFENSAVPWLTPMVACTCIKQIYTCFGGLWMMLMQNLYDESWRYELIWSFICFDVRSSHFSSTSVNSLLHCDETKGFVQKKMMARTILKWCTWISQSWDGQDNNLIKPKSSKIIWPW